MYYVRHERRMRAKYGLAIPYQCMTAFGVGGEFRCAALPRLTNFWKQIEVPRGWHAVLPPSFTTRRKSSLKKNSGWWVVAYTESVVRTVAFSFFDAKESLRVWALSQNTCRLAQYLNLEPVFRTIANVTEAIRILDVVTNTRFDTLPIRWRNRG